MNVIELNTTLVEGNVAYQEELDIDDIEITPLVKSLSGVLGTQEELIQAIKDSDEEDWKKEYHLHFLEKHSKHLNESIY
ncbi:hypothetical protein HMPREF9075_00849 [Capnocytophaga sp. oral taxon 332 str. F0381]|jgi:hypothetical protein|uniref:hypothetical protein n=1 Tax=Capnocytophaga sp. oral taxon 332 TaxID=712213 RepID=UPI0002A3DBB0|nr:hypothetical protein [Capnocytophaga sp. oral taxon 332]EKY11049.1 hypothetical protein HMPREF9075_00849 [Capnocytophaga sp. oral taxon 332 str. F0381]